jgi:long-chain acyl-CoA synthetase
LREYSSPARAEIPASANVTDVIFRRARAEPGEVMLRKRTGAGSWQAVTASQFRAEVATLANGLMAAGIEPGDRVALMSRSRYEWTLIDYAIWAAGAVSVPVYETSSAEQVAWTLSDSSAHAIFAETSMHEEIISSVRGKLPGLAHLWMISALDAVASGGAQITEEQLEQRRTGRAATDQATIIYTSGTTGRPKGCEFTHGNLLAEVRSAVSALPEIFAAPGCSTLLFLPLAHAYARTIQIGCLEAGAILGHWPDTATLADGLTEFCPTFLLAVPRVFEKLYDAAWQQASASAARARIFAAAAETAIDWSKAMGGRPRPPAAARPVRPPRLPQTTSGGRRPRAVRDLRRCAARGAARPLLPRLRHHGSRGLRADRDLGRCHREQAGPPQDRHRRPARARRHNRDRRRRRDPAPGAQRLPRILA